MRVSGISLTLRIRTVCQALLLALLLLLLLLRWLRLSSLGQYGAEHKCHQVSAVFAHSEAVQLMQPHKQLAMLFIRPYRTGCQAVLAECSSGAGDDISKLLKVTLDGVRILDKSVEQGFIR